MTASIAWDLITTLINPPKTSKKIIIQTASNIPAGIAVNQSKIPAPKIAVPLSVFTPDQLKIILKIPITTMMKNKSVKA